jgi:endogenous inhibitor of DNA gyrase (YacG/DUF329 family)
MNGNVKCANCGAKLDRKLRNGQIKAFCNKECRNEWQRNNKPHNYQEKTIVYCDTCGKEIQRTKSQLQEHNYCCHKCYTESKKKQVGDLHPLYNRIELTCDTCGKTINLTNTQYNRAKRHFCSLECKHAFVEESNAKQGYKICTKCNKEIKATPEYFYRDGQTRDGLSPHCKECRNAQIKANYHKGEAVRKAYRANNKEKIKLTKIKFLQNNEGYIRMYMQKRRHKQRNLPATLTSKQWEQIKTDFDNSCAYCGKIPDETLEQDHFIPVTRNGGYTKYNILPACRSCNASKSNKNFNDWFKYQEFYSKKQEQKILNYIKSQKFDNADEFESAI